MKKKNQWIKLNIVLVVILALIAAPVTSYGLGAQRLSDAVKNLQNAMVARQDTAVVYFYSWDDFTKDNAMRDELFYAACSEEIADSYNTGAYLKSNVKGCEVSTQKIGTDPDRWKVVFTNITYRTTAEQEAEFDARLQEVMAGLELEDKTEYEKCSAIYDYITSHVVYDTEAYQAHLAGDDSDYDMAYTAYSALINGRAVCQGYATLFYAMCRYAGLEVLMVDGIALGQDGWGDHAWNMVRIDGYWYQADPTWDADPSFMGYRYFLKGTDTFKNHRLNLDYTQDAFTSTHVMPVNSYKNAVNENPLIRLFKMLKELILGK